MAFIEWVVNTNSSGVSIDDTEESSDEITGWVEGIRIISPAGVDSGMTGTLTEVGGLGDTLWAGDIGASATIRKYPVHAEVSPDDTDSGTKGKFYMQQQKLKLELADAVNEVTGAATIRIKYIPDGAGA